MSRRWAIIAASVAVFLLGYLGAALAITGTLTVGDCTTTVSITRSETCRNAWDVKCIESCKCCDGGKTLSESFTTQAEAENFAKNVCGFLPDGFNHTGSSLVDNISFNYHHFAHDYKCAAGGAGCGSCGAAGARNGLPSLEIERRHRSRDMTEIGSFGPGVFCNYDAKLHFYSSDAGNIAYLFDPRDLFSRRFADGMDGDTNADGVFQQH